MQEASYGIIPLKKEGGEWKVFLIHHVKGAHWGFPKGHVEGGEDPLQAALRELNEETGLLVVKVLLNTPLQESYTFLRKGERVEKTASYYPALVSGEVRLQPSEIKEGRWVSVADAYRVLTFKESQNVLKNVEAHGFFYEGA